MKKGAILLALIALALSPIVVFASNTNGTIDSTYKYAWSNNLGWINFSATYGSVAITDDGITGHAWSDNYGWINLGPANSGVTNDAEGDLGGYAWGESAGWIDFSSVAISATGIFSGTAIGTVIGTLTFDCPNCDVRTDWRPLSTRGGRRAVIYQCNDSIDNDGDGLVDLADPDCSTWNDNKEAAEGDVEDGSSPTSNYDWPGGFEPGDLIKVPEFSTVYYIGDDGMRHFFPDEGTYFSHFSDFSSVQETTLDILRQYTLGSNMTYNSGSLLKIRTVPKVYLVGDDGLLHWLVSEEVFLSLGYSFADVHDVSDAFWQDYRIGSNIN